MIILRISIMDKKLDDILSITGKLPLYTIVGAGIGSTGGAYLSGVHDITSLGIIGASTIGPTFVTSNRMAAIALSTAGIALGLHQSNKLSLMNGLITIGGALGGGLAGGYIGIKQVF
jgi:hypothetical protein